MFAGKAIRWRGGPAGRSTLVMLSMLGSLAMLAVLACLCGPGCGSHVSSPDDERATGAEGVDPALGRGAGDAAAAPLDANAPLVAFLGDSLTAGLGLADVRTEGYPAVIERTLRDEGLAIRIVNAGISGDTSAGGLSRLPRLLEQHPDVLVVALGGNDGLRGTPAAGIRENLRKIVTTAQAQDVAVLLLGLKMPPNYGPEYTAAFEQNYHDLAEELDVPLVPFMLEGVAGDPRFNQGDGIHPTAEGQRLIAAHVLPALRPLIEAAR